ncbi:MAG TPA: hypothetical protein VLF18_04390 [Tahibacter sp.]|uniref:hypothetical protein n=1 Tax=Tahibacter sp. TaxID=2056211 RepID=UPI002C34CCA0|nr:hypothetical protein [Tahibacter sp.]HSX59422.1 hypothetical protein [Tahibacter sp.]
MRKYLHWFAIGVFVLTLLWQCLLWGGASTLPEIGPLMRRSAMREAPLVAGLMVSGEMLGKVPALGDLGRGWAAKAFEPAKERIVADPAVAMDYVFGEPLNSSQRLATRGVYALPILLALAIILWFRRPRQVRMLGAKRR